jgi:CheY-like chemotaxis protein
MVSDRSRPIPNVELAGINGTITLPLEKPDLEDLLSSPAQEEVSSDEKTLLLIDDNAIHNEALSEFAEMVVDRCLIATSAGEAYKTLETHSVDCIVLDLTLPDSSGKDVLKKIKETDDWSDIPVIIYSGRSLTPGQKNELLVQADDVILKNIGSHSKLMKRLSQLVEEDKTSQRSAPDPSAASKTNNTVLVVDDDDQSFFSISSLLESNGHRVRRAVSGRGALQILNVHRRDISLVLLDLMMPDMDGYQTIQKIRQEKELKSLPVFIVTAKAMKGDREECLRHGATDYISKPVSPEKLEKLMSIWMD